MREKLISMVETLAESERFRQENFFMCGAATGHPNFKLLELCEKYLETVKSNVPNEKEVNDLAEELRLVAEKGSSVMGANSIQTNTEYINEILAHKDELLNS